MKIHTLLKHPVTRQLGGAVAGMVIALGAYEGYMVTAPHLQSFLAQSLPPIIPLGSFSSSSSSSLVSSAASVSSSAISSARSSSVSSSVSSINTEEAERLRRQAQIAELARTRYRSTTVSSVSSSASSEPVRRRVIVNPDGGSNDLPPIVPAPPAEPSVPPTVPTANVVRRTVATDPITGDHLPQSGPGLVATILASGAVAGYWRQRRRKSAA